MDKHTNRATFTDGKVENPKGLFLCKRVRTSRYRVVGEDVEIRLK